MTKTLDKTTLRKLIVSLLRSDDELCADVFNDLSAANSEVIKQPELDKRKELEKIIREDFAEYDEVFKALA